MNFPHNSFKIRTFLCRKRSDMSYLVEKVVPSTQVQKYLIYYYLIQNTLFCNNVSNKEQQVCIMFKKNNFLKNLVQQHIIFCFNIICIVLGKQIVLVFCYKRTQIIFLNSAKQVYLLMNIPSHQQFTILDDIDNIINKLIENV